MSSPRVGMVQTKVRSMTTKDAQGLLNFRRAACGIDSFSRGSTSGRRGISCASTLIVWPGPSSVERR